MATELYHGGPVQGRGKIFIKPIDHPEAEWKELSNGLTATDFIAEESGPEFVPVPETGLQKIVLNFTIRLKPSTRKRMFLQIRQMCGLAKRPKFTYKTIKRDCAKRNGRWTGQ